MKRIRHEQVHSMLQHYLKRRQYSDVEVAEKKERRWTHDVKDMALKSSPEASTDNILSYSSISVDASVCEHQFSRFKNWLNDAVEPFRTELNPVLCPVFINLYIQLLCNGHKAQGHKFFNRHSKLFDNDLQYTQILSTLQKLSSRADVLSCKQAIDFRDKKYSITLSNEAFNYLKKFLKVDDNTAILQIFSQNVEVQVREPDEKELELGEGGSGKSSEPSGNGEKKRPTDIVRLLQQCIKQIREGPLCLSSICFYTFLNAYQGLCTVDLSPQKTLLGAGFEDSSVKLWSITPGLIQSTKCSADPSQIYIAANDWDIEEEEQEVQEQGKKLHYQEVAVLRAHNGAVYKTCFTADSKNLLSCSQDTTIRLWDLDTHSGIVCYRGHNYPVWDIDTSSVGNYFVSASQDRTAKLWMTDRIYPLRTFGGHTSDVDCVKLHPNCNYMATGSSDKTVRLWSLQDGKSVRLLQGHKGGILALSFSPNGQFLASAGDDKRVRVWDLGSGNLYKEFRGHTDTVHALSFNRDSTMLASGGLDASIKIWDIRKGHSSSVTEGHVSPEILGSFSTKSATVAYLEFTKHNLLLGAGAI